MAKRFSETEREEIAREFQEILSRDPWEILEGMRLMGTIVLNSDDLFMCLPRYKNNPAERVQLGAILYPIAKTTTNQLFNLLLTKKTAGKDIVVFTSGGSAVGKSTLLRAAAKQDDAAFIVDTTLSDFKRASQMINAARKARFFVEIHYVFRPFPDCVRSMVKRALDPQSGRMVPIDDMARTHWGSQNTLLELAKTAEGASDRALTIKFHHSIHRELHSLSPESFLANLHPPIDVLQRIGDDLLNGLREKYRHSSRSGTKGSSTLCFDDAFYEATRSAIRKGQRAARKKVKSRASKGDGNSPQT